MCFVFLLTAVNLSQCQFNGSFSTANVDKHVGPFKIAAPSALTFDSPWIYSLRIHRC